MEEFRKKVDLSELTIVRIVKEISRIKEPSGKYTIRAFLIPKK